MKFDAGAPNLHKCEIPIQLRESLHAIFFTHQYTHNKTKKFIRGAFVAAAPEYEGYDPHAPSESDKSLLAKAIHVARSTAIFEGDKELKKKKRLYTKVLRGVDNVLAHIWKLKWKDPTKYFTKIEREVNGIPPKKSRAKPLSKSERKRQVAMTRLAERLLADQVRLHSDQLLCVSPCIRSHIHTIYFSHRLSSHQIMK